MVLVAILLLVSCAVFAQDGIKGIQTATEKVKGFFGVGEKLILAVGGIIGLVGAVRVYQKWCNGDQETGKVAAAWFGASIFLVVVGIILQSFFGL